MLARLCELREDITTILDSAGRQDDDLTQGEWDDLALVCKILRPFSDVIREWEGEKYVTLSRVWPLACSLQRVLERNVLNVASISPADRLPLWASVTQVKYPASFALRRALRAELARADRFGTISMVMRLATVLDPRTKDLDAFDDTTKDQMRDALRDAILGLAENTGAEEREVDEEEVEEVQQAASVSIISTLLKKSKKKKRANTSLDDEITQYLEEDVENDVEPLVWWRQKEPRFPRVARLAKKYLALPASSAPSERMFSKMNAVVDKRRASLDPDRVERIVFIKQNKSKP